MVAGTRHILLWARGGSLIGSRLDRANRVPMQVGGVLTTLYWSESGVGQRSGPVAQRHAENGAPPQRHCSFLSSWRVPRCCPRLLTGFLYCSGACVMNNWLSACGLVRSPLCTLVVVRQIDKAIPSQLATCEIEFKSALLGKPPAQSITRHLHHRLPNMRPCCPGRGERVMCAAVAAQLQAQRLPAPTIPVVHMCGSGTTLVWLGPELDVWDEAPFP